LDEYDRLGDLAVPDTVAMGNPSLEAPASPRAGADVAGGGVEPPLEPEDRWTPKEFGPVAWRLILELAETNPAVARRLRREGVLDEEAAD
jgi:hypothetical protein